MFVRSLLVLLLLQVVLGACDRPASPRRKIKLDLYLMGQCQFGAELMRELLPTVRALDEYVDFGVEYIGSGKPGALKSVRGTGELLSDKLQLCALDVGGRAKWIGFLECQSKNSELIPQNWQACAKEVGIEEATLGTCAFGTHGEQALAASFSASEAREVNLSPTLFVAGKPYQGGRSRPHLARAICAALAEERPAYCSALEVPELVEVTVIGDKRCAFPDCGLTRVRELLDHHLANAKVRELDWADDDARKAFREAKASQLPLVLFSESLQEDAWAAVHLRSAIRQTGSKKFPFAIEFPSGWMPTSEGQLSAADLAALDAKKSRKNE